MSSSRKQNGGNADEQLITVETGILRDNLNRAYNASRTKTASFDHLWDMKEMALLEGKKSIDVPRTWIDELNVTLNASTRTQPKTNSYAAS